ncbi:hypothetical protein PUN28_013938 [Cardiocondyla obscurior]|uniref:Uncharacterized protein n=1 Tax=Cardiocondyla obscurior TaxID=286306 RepID=A0AAW2F6Z2_9HYME
MLFLQHIYVDGEPIYKVVIKHLLTLQIPHVQPVSYYHKKITILLKNILELYSNDSIYPEDIKIAGFINVGKRRAIRRERQKDRKYNKYIWMGPPDRSDEFGLRNLYNMNYDPAFEPESWD